VLRELQRARDQLLRWSKMNDIVDHDDDDDVVVDDDDHDHDDDRNADVDQHDKETSEAANESFRQSFLELRKAIQDAQVDLNNSINNNNNDDHDMVGGGPRQLLLDRLGQFGTRVVWMGIREFFAFV